VQTCAKISPLIVRADECLCQRRKPEIKQTSITTESYIAVTPTMQSVIWEVSTNKIGSRLRTLIHSCDIKNLLCLSSPRTTTFAGRVTAMLLQKSAMVCHYNWLMIYHLLPLFVVTFKYLCLVNLSVTDCRGQSTIRQLILTGKLLRRQLLNNNNNNNNLVVIIIIVGLFPKVSTLITDEK